MWRFISVKTILKYRIQQLNRSMPMNSKDKIKNIVKEKYGEIAKTSGMKSSCSCCCSGEPAADVYTTFHPDYSKKEGYVKEADLGLGCGIPTDTVHIQPGETVIDLGSGAGNDVFIAQRLVGETGTVIGIDMTQAMIDRARQNAEKLGYKNVQFRLGEIEQLPVDDNTADIVVSNCVINLVPDKLKAFQEIHRVLKPGGRFGISDIVITGRLPAKIQSAAEMYAGCVAGALNKEAYLGIVAKAGFANISIKKEKVHAIPDTILLQYLSQRELSEFKNSGAQILSITVYGEKPGTLMKKRILFLCTGNSARSQLAEGLMRHLRGNEFEVFSAGTEPKGVHPKTIDVLREIGIDTSAQTSKRIDELPTKDFDYIITLCDSAAQNCPVFLGRGLKMHHGFDDPAAAKGSDQEILESFRKVRDEIKDFLLSFNRA
jgi:thioredoxin type arsenate reductase